MFKVYNSEVRLLKLHGDFVINLIQTLFLLNVLDWKL